MTFTESSLGPRDDLAAATVRASAYSIAASAATLILGLTRSIVMARLLVPEDFGTVALALAFLEFAAPLRSFGLDQALVHRQTGDEASLDEILAVHFTLRLVLTGLFTLLLAAFAPLLRVLYPQRAVLVWVLLALATGEIARALGATPSTHLRKEMRFRELAALQVLTSLTMTITGPVMAWRGYGIWALVGERVSGVTIATLALWLVVRPWSPRLSLRAPLVKWYLDYGKFVFASHVLTPLMEQFDDFWVGTTLGSHPLGLYAKAYEFAQYPRRIISDPIAQVLMPVFSRAQDEPERLSKAFFRSASLVARLGFLVTGLLVLGAREFTAVILGPKWEPMVPTFQIMVIYTLLHPLLQIVGDLAAACGRPQINARFRTVQVAVFVPGVVLATRQWGIDGAAVAINLALILALAVGFQSLRNLVRFSLRRMLLAPVVASLLAGAISIRLPSVANSSLLLAGTVKASAYFAGYALLLLAVEWREYRAQFRLFIDLLPRKREGKS